MVRDSPPAGSRKRPIEEVCAGRVRATTAEEEGECLQACGGVPNVVLRCGNMGLIVMPLLLPAGGDVVARYKAEATFEDGAGRNYRNYELFTAGGRTRHVMRDRDGAVGCVDWGLLQEMAPPSVGPRAAPAV